MGHAGLRAFGFDSVGFQAGLVTPDRQSYGGGASQAGQLPQLPQAQSPMAPRQLGAFSRLTSI